MGIEEGSVTWEPGSGLPIDIQAHTGIVLSDPRWHAWLAERVQTYGYRAVIIDTLTTTVGDVDLDKAVDLQTRVLRPLREMAQMYDCSVVIVHHSRKNTGGSRRGSNMLGSVALHGWVDCALYLERDEESGEITVSPEGKHDPAEGWAMTVPRMYRDWHTGGRQVWAPEVTGEGPTPEPPRRQAGSKICGVLRGMGGRATAEDLQAVVGRGWRRQIDAAIERGTVLETGDEIFTVARTK